ncbi:flagellar assembly regulator FliX [Brevundimonas kwangchunensis]|uniref:Flagellar assembly regulator FliX n=1 Tax=Brevundimonas kwangchunensis TaxID=322163 RepID=A0ABN1GYC6_9CAUL
MKVNGPTGPSAPQGSRPARQASGGFALSSGGGAAPASAAQATSAMGGVTDVCALMALQGVEDPTERRRRAIRRGSGLLDRLDDLKLALLDGATGEAALDRLARTIREERPEDADPGLTQVLDQIDLRAAVELAKAEIRRTAA